MNAQQGKQSVLLILNPCAGRRKGEKRLSEILSVFQEANFLPTVTVTTKRGDATDYVKTHGADYDRIVCIGGDGTFSEVMSGVITAGLKEPIGYIPTGSTNDFATGLRLSKDPLMAAKRIANGQSIKLDVGRFNEHYFSYVASFGLFSQTSYATSQRLKNKLGHLAYLLEGAKELIHYPTVSMRIRTDDAVLQGNYLFGAVTNCLSLGGVLRFDEQLIRLNDGKLELLLVEKPKNPAEIERLIQALLTKNYALSRCLTFASTQTVEFETNRAFEWTLDGECVMGQAHTIVRNVPNAIQLIA